MKTRLLVLFIIYLGAGGCNYNKRQNQENNEDPYLKDVYLKLNGTPMQHRLRTLCPFPVGVVYYQQRGDNIDSIAKEFKIMQELGFNALKQIVLCSPSNPPGFTEQVFHKAIESGMIPWYYGQGGWHEITASLCDSLGITPMGEQKTIRQIQDDPGMIAWQNHFLHQRVNRMHNKPPKPKEMGEPGRNSPYLSEQLIPLFAQWLKETYVDMASLKEAWNEGYTGPIKANSFEEAALELKSTGTDIWGRKTGKNTWDFRRLRDAMRFQADLVTGDYHRAMELFNEWDPQEPERTGGHQLFENQALNGWDLEAQAKAGAVGGSFYSSIHLAHHFFLCDGEYIRPVYMQARIVSDMMKGGWAATWESTGGPTIWSGTHSYTVNANITRQLMLSYLAAGLKGIGFWSWNSRGEGWEAGEYALTDISGKPSERAIEAGHIAKIIQEQRFELWEAMDEPVAGILYSWENEAVLGRMSLGAYPLTTPVYSTDRDKQFAQMYSRSRTGISRALMNNNIPFEYVTENDLEAGLAGRYRIIILPHLLACGEKLPQILTSYVQEGGILIADVPLFFMDSYGRINDTQAGSWFESLFGFSINDYYHTRNNPLEFRNYKPESVFADITTTRATVHESFSKGEPAILSSAFGKGRTIVFNFNITAAAEKPGNLIPEEGITEMVLKYADPPFRVLRGKNILVYRRSAPAADHYFVINEGDERTVVLGDFKRKYAKAVELIEGKPLSIGKTLKIEVPANSGVWIRCSVDRQEYSQ